jgi:hypothetical protein
MNRLAEALRDLDPLELFSYYLHRQGLDDDEAALVLHATPATVALNRRRAQEKLESWTFPPDTVCPVDPSQESD